MLMPYGRILLMAIKFQIAWKIDNTVCLSPLTQPVRLNSFAVCRLLANHCLVVITLLLLLPCYLHAALHALPARMHRGLATRKLSVSVRPSVKHVDCDKTEERSVQICIPYERSFSLDFLEESLVGATSSTWNFGSTDPRWSEIADFEPIFARSASSVTPSEKSPINTNSNRKSTTRFPMSPRWTSYVVPKPLLDGSKRQSVQNSNNTLR